MTEARLLGQNPLFRGAALAALAAALFGATVPLLQRAGSGVGPFVTGALLYAGAALGASFGWGRKSVIPIPRAYYPRLLGVALLGAALAPAFLAWGLQRTSAFTASLLLNFEAVLTIALAALVYREHIGKRVVVAAGLMLGAGIMLIYGRATGGFEGLVGAAAVTAAVTCWALDNTLTRPLADLEPNRVVRFKAAAGATLSLAAVVVSSDRLPTVGAALAIVACGAFGYGVSLKLYLLAQRRIGAARTGSVFALAPFLGAALSWLLDQHAMGWAEWAATLLFALGLFLHLSERHAHSHLHEAFEHDHQHRHDDGHHDHAHDIMPAGEHSHPHRHERLMHTHSHGEDLHHRHRH